MFDAPLDGVVVWTGLSLVSLAVLGIALGLAGSGPEAGAVADAVDRVGTSKYGATATVPLDADAIRLGATRISLRVDSRTRHATLAGGPVTPVGDGQLHRVLTGRPVREVFQSQRAVERALGRYPTYPLEWRDAPAEQRVRRVVWGEVDATLVG